MTVAYSWLRLLIAVTMHHVLWAATLPTPQLFTLYPNKGSFAGGTYLVIKGVGWSRNGTAGTTEAYFTVNGVTSPCKQNQGVILDSTDTNFVCWAPSLLDVLPGGGRVRYFSYRATVNVYAKDLDGNSVKAAWSSGSSGYFYYNMDSTPTVVYASLGGYAGSVLSAFGALKANDGTKYVYESTESHPLSRSTTIMFIIEPKLANAYPSYLPVYSPVLLDSPYSLVTHL